MSHVQNAEYSINDFANDLIGTKDLDPVYPMLVQADLPEHQRDAWLMSYFVFIT